MENYERLNEIGKGMVLSITHKTEIIKSLHGLNLASSCFLMLQLTLIVIYRKLWVCISNKEEVRWLDIGVEGA